MFLALGVIMLAIVFVAIVVVVVVVAVSNCHLHPPSASTLAFSHASFTIAGDCHRVETEGAHSHYPVCTNALVCALLQAHLQI